APTQPLELGFSERALDAHRVLALEAVTRMHQTVGELAIIGEKEQPRAVDVEPADCNPAARRQPRKDRRPPGGVAARDELAFRLVVHEDAPGALASDIDRAAIDGDGVARRRAIAELGDAAVEGYPPGVNPRFDFAPRAEARGREQLLEALSLRCRWRRRLRLRARRSR